MCMHELAHIEWIKSLDLYTNFLDYKFYSCRRHRFKGLIKKQTKIQAVIFFVKSKNSEKLQLVVDFFIQLKTKKKIICGETH